MANPGQAISFDSNSLQTDNILTAQIDHESSPDRAAQIIEIAHTNANAIPYDSWPKKVVNVSGTLEHTSITNLDALTDTFKSYLLKKGGNLDIAYNGSTRRYVGTKTRDVLSRPHGLLKTSFSLEFTCLPFGQDITVTSLINQTGLTAATRDDTVTFGGTAPVQYPVITITFNSITGGTNASVSVTNNNNGQGITITRTWANGDILVIDTTQLLNTLGVSSPVTVNGSAVDYSGGFPLFAGAASIHYADTFTARNFDYTVNNTNRYI